MTDQLKELRALVDYALERGITVGEANSRKREFHRKVGLETVQALLAGLDAARAEGRRSPGGGVDLLPAASYLLKDAERGSWGFTHNGRPARLVAYYVDDAALPEAVAERYADAADAVIAIDRWLSDLAKADEGKIVSREIRRYSFNEDDGGALLYFRDNQVAAGGFLVRDLHNYSVEMRVFAPPPPPVELPGDVARLVEAASDVVKAHSDTVFGIPSLAASIAPFASRAPSETGEGQ